MIYTDSWVGDTKTVVGTIIENEFERLSQNLWWPKVAKVKVTENRKAILHWLLATAKLQRGSGTQGMVDFENALATSWNAEVSPVNSGFRVHRDDIVDLDSFGLDAVAQWARDIMFKIMYWPQQEVARVLLSNPTCYDTKALFATDHPVNPADTSKGTYSNLISSVPLTGNTRDAALTNLYAVRTAISKVKMTDGVSPKMLQMRGILHPPAMSESITQLLNAHTIAQSAASGGGGANVEAVISKLGLGSSWEAPELGANFTNGSDSTYYVLCEDTGSQLGGMVYVEREPFEIKYNGPDTDSELATKMEMQWNARGRNVVAPGIPYYIFKCTA